MKSKYISEAEITEKIINSQKELSIIGTTAFNFGWDSIVSNGQTFEDVLADKFFATNSQYEISIIRESEPQIVQYVQYKYAVESVEDRDFPHYQNINEKYELLRKHFRSRKNENLEPTENVCRKALDAIFDDLRIKGIIEKLIERDHDKETVLSSVFSNLINIFERAAFMKIKTTPEYIVISKLTKSDPDGLSSAFSQWFKTFYANRFEKMKSLEDLFALIKTPQELSIKDEFKFSVAGTEIGIEVVFSLKDEKDIRNNLVEACFEYLAKIEPNSYDQIKNDVSSFASEKREKELSKFKSQSQYKQRFFLKTIFDNIEMQIIRVDDEYFCAYPDMPNMFVFVGKEGTEKNDFEFAMRKQQYERYVNAINATEVTDKGDRKEYVNAYIAVATEEGKRRQNRIRVGLRARESFNYFNKDTMLFVKNVAWALVFDHGGNLLLHRRGMNAKDNQDMWDKSVGGHISHNDPDAIFGARREILEELYEIEGIEQGHHEKQSNLAEKNPENIRFFGQWKPGVYPKLNEGIELEAQEFYCFKVDFEEILNPHVSERKLPNGTIMYNNCFVDLFFVVTSDAFDVSDLKNSKYLLLPPSTISSFYNSKKLPAQYSPTGTDVRFEVTPDLAFMIRNHVFWGSAVRKFSDEVREAFSNRKTKK